MPTRIQIPKRIFVGVGESTSFGSKAAVVTPGRTAGSDVRNSFRRRGLTNNCQMCCHFYVKSVDAPIHKNQYMFATSVLVR